MFKISFYVGATANEIRIAISTAPIPLTSAFSSPNPGGSAIYRCTYDIRAIAAKMEPWSINLAFQRGYAGKLRTRITTVNVIKCLQPLSDAPTNPLPEN
jgi:hypothetical protein